MNHPQQLPEDPFELLSDDLWELSPSAESFREKTLAPPSQRERKMQTASANKVRKGRVNMASVALMGVFLGVLGGGILWLTPKADDGAHFAYLEMRAIGPHGRPVAGASVKEKDLLLGYTDSFGEWRRYLKVELGQTLVLNIEKKLDDGSLEATKNIAIPAEMPRHGELEIKTQIGLLRQSFDHQEPELTQKESETPPAPSAPPESLPKIWVRSLGDIQKAGLTQKLLAATVQGLKEQFEKNGYRVEEKAPFVVSIGVLEYQGQGLFYVRGDAHMDSKEGKNSKKLFSFLRALSPDAAMSQADVLRGLQRYGVRDVWSSDLGLCESFIPCSIFSPPVAHSPPFPQWQRQQVKTSLPSGEGFEVFISGFEARALGGQVFEFWAPLSGPTNVTVLKDGAVFYREKILAADMNKIVIPQGIYSNKPQSRRPADMPTLESQESRVNRRL